MKLSNINDNLTMFFKNCIFASKKFILKKLNAFSVIELLISLIVISLTLAAFAPVISRKLTTSSVVLNGIISGGNNNNNNNTGGNVSMPDQLYSQEVCDKLAPNLLFLTAAQNGGKRACVTKANVGDTYMNGPEITAAAGVSISNGGGSCEAAKCCWNGNNVYQTAKNCTETGNGDSTYSGCKRTVCTWNAAMAACENWEPISGTKGKWRMPTKDELSAWIINVDSIQNNKGSNGLQLCDEASSDKGSVRCGAGARCEGGDHVYCDPSFVWSSEDYTDYDYDSSKTYHNAYIAHLYSGEFSAWSYDLGYALSARCMLDENAYKEVFGGNSNNNSGTDNSTSTLPTDITSQSDCDKIGKNLLFLTSSQNDGKAACVTKANVGDSYNNGPDLDKIKSSAGITVVNAGTSCGSSSDYSSKCCWLGNNVGTTASSCTDSGNGNSTYFGCKRTVCTWAAAKAACTAYEPDGSGTKGKWRLPTQSELSAWGSNLSTIQTNKGKSGLELCDWNYGYGSVRCNYTSDCPGAMDSECDPYLVWSSDEDSSSLAYLHYLSSGGFLSGSLYKTGAFSARCVLDAKAYKNSTISGGGSSLPTSLTSQADCDKLGSNLLFLNASQNGGKRACVTKANVGDSYANGPDLDKIKSSAGITVVNAGTVCGSANDYTTKCCWLGNNIGITSNTCDTASNGDSTYSGCKRTACNWNAAKAACENWESVSGTKGKWRLPTTSEMSAWSNNLSTIQFDMGKSGLELCNSVPGFKSIDCYPDSTACKKSASGYCNLHYIWSSNLHEYTEGSAYVFGFNRDKFIMIQGGISGAYSARCVLDEDSL